METNALTGTVALVTGAAGGIGQAIVRRLAADGATVVAVGHTLSEPLDALATEVGGIALAADLADPAACHALVAEAEQRVGRVDNLVANHAYMTMGPLVDYDLADWWRVVDTNLGGTFHLIQAVVPGMVARGGGRITMVTSEWGVIGWPEATAYAASKAGLISLTKTLGRELAPQGVVVNAVAPGVIDTPQLEVDADAAGISLTEMHARYAADIPLARIGRPEEIAAVVALLSDPRLGSLVGQVVQANGGSTRSRA